MDSRTINEMYLSSMLNAHETKDPVLYKVAKLWWPHYVEMFNRDPRQALDNLDIFMNFSREKLFELAKIYSQSKISDISSDAYQQRIVQFLKSNTGKMFERFIGLAIAYALHHHNSEFSVWPFRSDLKKVCNHLKKEDFEISCRLGDVSYKTNIDSDLIIFSPTNKDLDFYMLSVKSTLKDRFHNVPFWNLLRLCAINNVHNITTSNDYILSKAKYVAACTDLAEEQPDFSREDGPRNLLCLDAALLDGAYVSSSRAIGLGYDNNHFGAERNSAFYPLSKFVEMLC